MSVDFYTTNLKETLNVVEFGLLDSDPRSEPCSNVAKKDKWICTVLNPKGLSIDFRPIDKNPCIKLLKNTSTGSSKNQLDKCCDVMLCDSLNTDFLIFVELKDRNTLGDWFKVAEAQLRSTITHYKAHHGDPTHSNLIAYASNKQFFPIQSIHTTAILKFVTDTGFELIDTNTINI